MHGTRANDEAINNVFIVLKMLTKRRVLRGRVWLWQTLTVHDSHLCFIVNLLPFTVSDQGRNPLGGLVGN